MKNAAKEITNKLGNIKIGETVDLGGLEFIVLEHSGDTTAVILKDFWDVRHFDSFSNNYAKSEIRYCLNEPFYQELVEAVGKENIVKHTVDLTTDDGHKEYGKCQDHVSLLTVDLYKRYTKILNKYIPRQFWWLATAYSTLSDCRYIVRDVDYSGALCLDSCICGDDRGVRPFCILKSNVFVS